MTKYCFWLNIYSMETIADGFQNPAVQGEIKSFYEDGLIVYTAMDFTPPWGDNRGFFGALVLSQEEHTHMIASLNNERQVRPGREILDMLPEEIVCADPRYKRRDSAHEALAASKAECKRLAENPYGYISMDMDFEEWLARPNRLH